MADETMTNAIGQRLLKARHALLDLSARNRLLNTPLRTRNNRAIEIVDEKADEVFRTLSDGKAMTFLAGETMAAGALDPDDSDTAAIPQPGDDAVDARGVAVRHSDSRLQTKLTSEGLQKRLFDIWDDARTLESEQGVNILYLALGLLKWFDAEASDVARYAPLVLLPVQLERSSAADRFKLKGRDEPPSPNLTLQAKMKTEFGLTIEDFGEDSRDEDAVDLGAYAAKVAQTVSRQGRWEVLPDAMVLGFFSFSKFLMYRDLDPDNWPDTDAEDGIEQHPLIRALLHDGFPDSPPLIADDARIDEAIPAGDQSHVVDADSSQAVAIAEAAGGRTLVVKGPPGTGKSQTITNIIAAAVARGKTVLFVAEKMAALDVVHRRLKQAGLGPLTLELHSNKISKRAVLEELRRTKDGALRPMPADTTLPARLDDARVGLNGFADRLHAPLEPSGATPYQILGRLATWQDAGGPGSEVRLEGAPEWTAEDFAQRRQLGAEIVERLAGLGPIPLHPWRGVGADALEPAERDRVARDIAASRAALVAARTEAAVATQLFGAPEAVTVADLDRSLAYLQLTPLPRDADRTAFADDAWQNLKGLTDLLTTGTALVRLRQDARAVFNDAGLSADYHDIRADIVTKGRGLLRFLDGPYKRHIALLRSYLKGELPKDSQTRVKLADLAIGLQKSERDFAAAAPLGRAFGRLWQGADSDWDALDNVLRWRRSHNLPADVWPRLAALSDAGVAEGDRARQALYAAMTAHATAGGAYRKTLALDTSNAFGGDDGKLEVLIERSSVWLSDMESLSRFIAFAARGRALAALGAAGMVDNIHAGTLDAASVLAELDGAYSLVLRDALFTAWPELRGFEGLSQDSRVTEFRKLDLASLDLAKAQIAAQHADGRPKGAAGIGPLGVLNGELAKKRAHLPIRVLLEKAGPAIQQLKPVFMMAPLSVAQFLKPGAVDFDLLVMDEASQIEPVDALGAVARVKQLVVVGDERQLPPTAFFKKLTGEDEREDDDDLTLQARDAESILDLCLAKGAPYRLLSWHYRSKHQSLIAVSNREFYDNRLFIVPSPYDAIAGMGLKFHKHDKPYDKYGKNPGEAEVIVKAILDHAERNPSETLGVATFSVEQRSEILQQLEKARRSRPDLESFFSADSVEPFFVKNLENIQGDERDVIFISATYGRNSEGVLNQRFGPLNREGGERRLNVLISRAKLRCEVFCNFSGADIDLERSPSRGIAALKMYLTFAETGHFGQGEAAGDGHDSAFEQAVCAKLRGLGHDVKTQIGASGFRVDLAIADAAVPGRFVLGIECDGAQYHASRSARDRDRLRQQVLEAHGWIIHRIWSADWYLRPKEELRRMEAAIQSAKDTWRGRDVAGYQMPRAVPLSFDVAQGEDGPVMTASIGREPAAPANLYHEVSFVVARTVEPQDLPLGRMVEIVTRIVTAEGPVHGDEIAARIRALWDLPRLGAKVKGAVAQAVEQAAIAGLIDGGPFYTAPAQAITVRDRSKVASQGLRKPDMLPPVEIDQAIVTTVADNFGATVDELVVAVARAFGFSATSPALRAVLETRIARLVETGLLVEKGRLLSIR